MNKIIVGMLALLATTFLPTPSFAQNMVNANLQWSAQRAMNIQSGEMLESPGAITTTGKTTLEWKNDDGSVRYTFVVNEVVGHWENVKKAGTITYEIAGDGGNGTATFQKNDNGTTIKLFLTKAGESQLFELSGITLQVL